MPSPTTSAEPIRASGSFWAIFSFGRSFIGGGSGLSHQGRTGQPGQRLSRDPSPRGHGELLIKLIGSVE